MADGPPFAEPWQAHAFALVLHLHAQGVFTWTEWAQALAEELRRGEREAAPAGYYGHWLAAIERLLLARGLVDRRTLVERRDAWVQAYRTTPHGKPVALPGRS
jgi:nitrile hydratase accessory protein